MSKNVLDQFFADNEEKEVEVTTPEPKQEEETKVESVEAKAQTNKKKEEDLAVTSDGQFSLFGDDFISAADPKTEESKSKTDQKEKKEEEKEEPKKESKSKATSKKGSSSTTTSTSKGKGGTKKSATTKVDPKTFKVEGDWTVHYAAQTFTVDQFFDPMPTSGEVTLEELRQKMEEEFFEMTEARTKWDLRDKKKKRVYPDVSGTAKGLM
ncbi:type II secretory pathway component GspD/PulD (secretin) [Evansella vedderi]|uniref:Type II secretory pathway component GspD/PulD (Secretin) n=1 Tax=Evansella vedderi TaxID=38282 RepID=A0ABT9ZWG0_9BACI|nr:hypothetical protein [Evansella vedderi]MDQ0255559.1 type II secretory pathway component GspD/PulD (secretin) [Evansella vedderi]